MSISGNVYSFLKHLIHAVVDNFAAHAKDRVVTACIWLIWYSIGVFTIWHISLLWVPFSESECTLIVLHLLLHDCYLTAWGNFEPNSVLANMFFFNCIIIG